MAKKKGSSKKKKPAAPGVDPNEKRRERLEARRRAKAEALAAKQRAERRARIVRTLAYAGLLAVAIWFFFLRGDGAPSQIAGHEIDTYSSAGENDHAGEGETVNYAESPPVSGRHAASPFDCGSYGEPVPNENLVHSLEHGAVYALYAPDLPIAQIRTLEEIAADYEENVLVAPYEGEMETPVAIGSWGRRMDLPRVDEGAIRQYIDEFEGTGTQEADLGCPNDSDDEFEPDPATTETPEPGGAPQPDATETATPEPDTTPKSKKGKASKASPQPTASS